MSRPLGHDQHIPCPACKLMDWFVIYNERRQQSAVVCQHCRVVFLEINYVPETLPDPAVII